MNFELFSRTIENKDHTCLCRFCLAEDATDDFESKKVAQLYKQITNDNLTFSPDHPTFVCNICLKNLRTAAKIRNDITQMEKYWKKYIDEMPAIMEIKIEDMDDEYDNFETVEMIIEPVDTSSPGFNEDDYWDNDGNFGTNRESYSFDGGSIDNSESISDLDASRDGDRRIITQVVLRTIPQSSHPENFETIPRNSHPETSENRQFVCDICQKSYSSRYGIRTHMKRHMQSGSADVDRCKKIKRYKCSSCAESFSKKVQLVEHEFKHSGVAFHVCHICGIGKKSKALMNSHLRTHNPDYIGKTSLTRSKSKSTKRYFTCWMCPTRVDFNSLDELKIHRKNLHHDFQCKFCKNGFMTNEALQSHILIHGTQERPHLCTYCGGTFAKIGHLNSHIQGKHAEQKPYPCDKCPKGFVHRYQLLSHIRIFHEKIKAFHCTECPTSFGHAKSRVWHMRTVHNM